MRADGPHIALLRRGPPTNLSMTPNDTLARANGARPLEHRWLVAHLIDAMHTETRLLDELRRLTQLQRDAVAAADHGSLDDTALSITWQCVLGGIAVIAGLSVGITFGP